MVWNRPLLWVDFACSCHSVLLSLENRRYSPASLRWFSPRLFMPPEIAPSISFSLPYYGMLFCSVLLLQNKTLNPITWFVCSVCWPWAYINWYIRWHVLYGSWLSDPDPDTYLKCEPWCHMARFCWSKFGVCIVIVKGFRDMQRRIRDGLTCTLLKSEQHIVLYLQWCTSGKCWRVKKENLNPRSQKASESTSRFFISDWRIHVSWAREGQRCCSARQCGHEMNVPFI